MVTNSRTPRPRVVKRGAGRQRDEPVSAWKLAYADFMTALMAFFLLMWIMTSATPSQRTGIAEYFDEPLRVPLPGGDRIAVNSSIIPASGGDISTTESGVVQHTDGTMLHPESQISSLRGEDGAREQVRLHDLQIRLLLAIQANPVLARFQQQIRVDSTLAGLRIEIVDSQRRPMFATASAEVEPYMRDILHTLGLMFNDVPNHLVIEGHTDAAPYAGGEVGYSNWELSMARANASRRELIAGGLDAGKVLRVAGLAATQNLDRANPLAPENRRISLVVLNSRSEAELTRDGTSVQAIRDAAEVSVQPERSTTYRDDSAHASH
ncbi:flagellar motor protein MotB [Paraburkholderia tropica]|uniref:flagellar motor protein MotB n=1 Tax=Paraburkholderia tropica TaxID=92647 RepID=UPI002AAF83B7|nr:flagellar motor protein MotB [Paraburkholderia tropica]